MGPLLLRPKVAAATLNLSVQALAKMRCYGKGPVFVKIGRCVLYRPSDLDKWIASQVRKPKKKVARKKLQRLYDPVVKLPAAKKC